MLGDVIFYDWDGDGSFQHSTIVTAFDAAWAAAGERAHGQQPAPLLGLQGFLCVDRKYRVPFFAYPGLLLERYNDKVRQQEQPAIQ